MAFMEGSTRYDVHGVSFPGTRVILRFLEAEAGYDAMLLVTGFVTALLQIIQAITLATFRANHPTQPETLSLNV